MTKKTGMRVKDVGATINLGNYSSLHITIGEEAEYAGLDLGKAQTYLRRIAESVGGTLNLPDKGGNKPKQNNITIGEPLYAYNSSEKMLYDHTSHSYTSEDGKKYESVTQVVSKFYPFNEGGVIAKEYMDFASAYGNMIHTAIQNTVVGKQPKKSSVKKLTDAVLAEMGEFYYPVVEQMVVIPEYEIAGRFDILTKNSNGKYTLWDVKTNSDLFAKANCKLPEDIKKELNKTWGVDTVYGEHCLQLNIYAYILEKHCGIEVEKIKIIHVPDDFEAIVNVEKRDITPVLDLYKASK